MLVYYRHFGRHYAYITAPRSVISRILRANSMSFPVPFGIGGMYRTNRLFVPAPEEKRPILNDKTISVDAPKEASLLTKFDQTYDDKTAAEIAGKGIEETTGFSPIKVSEKDAQQLMTKLSEDDSPRPGTSGAKRKRPRKKKKKVPKKKAKKDKKKKEAQTEARRVIEFELKFQF